MAVALALSLLGGNRPFLLAGVVLGWLAYRDRALTNFKKVIAAEFRHVVKRHLAADAAARANQLVTGPPAPSTHRVLVTHLPPIKMPRELLGTIRRTRRAWDCPLDLRTSVGSRKGRLRSWRLRMRLVHHVTCIAQFANDDGSFDPIILWVAAGSLRESINKVLSRYDYDLYDRTDKTLPSHLRLGEHLCLALDADSYLIVGMTKLWRHRFQRRSSERRLSDAVRPPSATVTDTVRREEGELRE